MALSIVAVGKKNSPWLAEGISQYSQRMRKPFVVDWLLLPHSNSAERAVAEESQRILGHCRQTDLVILLDERGRQLSSPALARQVQHGLDDGRRVVFIIGGAFGVSQAVFDRADLVWTLSSLVLPHQLVRLILAEQLYRVQTIALGQKYHHQ